MGGHPPLVFSIFLGSRPLTLCEGGFFIFSPLYRVQGRPCGNEGVAVVTDVAVGDGCRGLGYLSAVLGIVRNRGRE